MVIKGLLLGVLLAGYFYYSLPNIKLAAVTVFISVYYILRLNYIEVSLK